MAVSFRSRISAPLIAASLLVASCSSGDSGDVPAATTIDDSFVSLSRALTNAKDTVPHASTHSRFITRMQAARASGKTLAAQAHLAALMWQVADLRKYRAVSEEYSVPLNTALHYIQQLHGGARAKAFRRSGEPDVTAAEFESVVAQLAALVIQSEKSTSPRAMGSQAGNPAISKKETIAGCGTMSEISEDVGILLGAALHEIPEVGWVFAGLTEIFWPSNCTENTTAALEAQLQELRVAISSSTFDIYNSRLDGLMGSAGDYNDAVQNFEDKAYKLRMLVAALKDYKDSKSVFQAVGATTEHSPALVLPLYATYVTQYLALIQDFVNNAGSPADCSAGATSVKWCDPSDTDGIRNAQLCTYKKELIAITYDPDSSSPDTISGQLDECKNDANPNGTYTFNKTDSAKLYVATTMKDTGIVPAATESTSDPNLKQVTWNARNAWTNATTLSAQDPSMYWPYMNIFKYPVMPCPGAETQNCNPAIPAVLITRELYSDIIGTIRDKEANDKAYSWVSRPGVGPHGETDAPTWLNYVKKHANKPGYGPPSKIVVKNGTPYCYLFATTCTWPPQVYDMQVSYAAFGGFSATNSAWVQGGAGTAGSPDGFSLNVGMPQMCDFDSTGKRWQSGGCELDLGRGPMFSFKAQVLTDVDKSALFGIPCIMVRFIDGRQNDAITGDPYGCDKNRNYQPGHFWSSDISGAGANTKEFSLPGSIISSITPYGINPADAYGAESLNAFIVGFRPYNAWGFSN